MSNELPDIIQRAYEFAEERHADQVYDRERGLLHVYHVRKAHEVLARFGIADTDIQVATVLHDVIEDTATTEIEVAETFGDRIAALVSAVTNESGANRKERAARTYPKIRAVPGAVVVKLADRIANVEHGGTLVSMYKKEHPGFRDALYKAGEADALWAHLDRLIDGTGGAE